MPIFEFRCLDCGSIFEKLFLNAGEQVEIVCPKCKSESFERVISRSNHIMGSGSSGKTKITTKSCSSGDGCVTLDIPGPK